MNLRLLAVSIALSSLALAGCGNKGPLVQAPPDPVEEEAPAIEQAPPTEDQTESKDLVDPASTPKADETAPPEATPVESAPEQVPPASDGGG